MKRTFKSDYKFGSAEELRLLPILEEKFDLDLELTEQGDRFDYIDTKKKVYIELKSRYNTKEKYPTTIITESKFLVGKRLQSEGWRIIYVFNFTDKICYIEPKSSDAFVVKNQGRRDRGKLEYHKHINFNITDLTDF